MAGLLLPGIEGLFLAHLGQLPGVKPVAATVGALVHLNAAAGAEEMAMELDALAARAAALAGRVHDDPFVPLNPKQRLPGRLALFIDALQFEGVEPNPPAAALADIHIQAANLELGQFMVTRRTSHRERILASVTHSRPRSRPSGKLHPFVTKTGLRIRLQKGRKPVNLQPQTTMIRRDYILRMIEEFAQVLSRIKSLKRGQLWREAGVAVDEEFQRLTGAGAAAVAQLTETELLARLIQGEPSQVVRQKALMLTTLLKEAGELAAAQGRPEEGRASYLKGLHLLLETLAHHEAFECPDFVPRVEVFVTALGDKPLPLETQGRLMQHYELTGEFGKAEDCLFAMLEADPGNAALVEFGIAFCERLRGQSDARLAAGNLPRPELEAGLAELRGLGAARAQPK